MSAQERDLGDRGAQVVAQRGDGQASPPPWLTPPVTATAERRRPGSTRAHPRRARRRCRAAGSSSHARPGCRGSGSRGERPAPEFGSAVSPTDQEAPCPRVSMTKWAKPAAAQKTCSWAGRARRRSRCTRRRTAAAPRVARQVKPAPDRVAAEAGVGDVERLDDGQRGGGGNEASVERVAVGRDRLRPERVDSLRLAQFGDVLAELGWWQIEVRQGSSRLAALFYEEPGWFAMRAGYSVRAFSCRYRRVMALSLVSAFSSSPRRIA